MNFSDKLKKLMDELNLSPAKLSRLTGINKSSISQYLSDKHEPTEGRKKDIARALGVQENYFDTFEPEATIQTNEVTNLSVALAARLMHKSLDWVKQGLNDGVFPWGYAVSMKKQSFWISSVKFTEYTGIQLSGKNEVVNLPVAFVAKLMHKSIGWVEQGLRDGVFPWGYAVRLQKWSFWISSVKFTEYTGIQITSKEELEDEIA